MSSAKWALFTGEVDLGLTMSKGYGALTGFLRELVGEGSIKNALQGHYEDTEYCALYDGNPRVIWVMQAGKALKGKPEVAPSVMVTYVEAFAEGIKKRGKCELGDRTILDLVDAAAEGARSLIDASFLKVMDTAVDGAKRL